LHTFIVECKTSTHTYMYINKCVQFSKRKENKQK